MGDGRVDSAALLSHARQAARRFVGMDMAQVAEQAGSVVSAALFGALAATGVLPWSRAQFEATIERGGVGVQSSLKAFGAAYEHVTEPAPRTQAQTADPVQPPAAREPAVAALLARVAAFPGDAQPLITEGIRRLIDYQDPAYAALYLDRLAEVQALPSDGTGALLRDAARHLALWMAYEDTVRVADLKTRGSRFARVEAEVRLQAGQQIAIQELSLIHI